MSRRDDVLNESPRGKPSLAIAAATSRYIPLSPHARLVMLSLYYHANVKAAECWVSNVVIGQETGLSERSVRRAIAELAFFGIVSDRHDSGDHNGALNTVLNGERIEEIAYSRQGQDHRNTPTHVKRASAREADRVRKGNRAAFRKASYQQAVAWRTEHRSRAEDKGQSTGQAADDDAPF